MAHPPGKSGKKTGGPPWLIGWKEYADFPEWDMRRVKVKIDTGARTSALDVVSYHLRETEGAALIAELRLGLDREHPERLHIVHTPVLQMVVVRNSSGMPEMRPLIETTFRLGPLTKRLLLTVTNRAGMRFPVILGRKALLGDFIVNVDRTYVWRKSKRSGIS